MTSDPADAVFARQRRRPIAVEAELLAEEALAATAGLAPATMRRSLGGDVIVTWHIAAGRTLVWYAQAEMEWRPARVVEQGDPSRSHWADVGDVEDLVAILREEMERQ